jgi:hypothetical protein
VTAINSIHDVPAGLEIGTMWQRRPLRTTTGRHGRLLPALTMAAVLAAGCGGEPQGENPGVTGPHGNPAIAIPGGLGYGEARLEASSGPSPTEIKKAGPAQIVVYFVEPDGKTPLTTLPEKVQALIGLPGTLPNKYIKVYELKNEPRGDEPVASARFASEAFALPEQRINGRVKAVLGGQEVSFPLVLAGMPTK